MRIQLVCPAPGGSRQGNRITAIRWVRILRGLGHRVAVTREYAGEDVDLLVAMHARRSAAAASAFHARHPERPLVVALTGTDLYRDVARDRRAGRSLDIADRLVVLHDGAARDLRAKHRGKVRAIRQSAPAHAARQPSRSRFDVCVLSHLRAVKDPLRAAQAARALPAESRIRIRHAGAALSTTWARRAQAEERRNPRYHWLGERSHAGAVRLLAGSRLLVLSSRMEGGANVIGEAAVAGIPVLASRVAGSVGLLGRGYPGLFPAGDHERLAALLLRCERDARFYARLVAHMKRIAREFRPAAERRAWRLLLGELAREKPRRGRRRS